MSDRFSEPALKNVYKESKPSADRPTLTVAVVDPQEKQPARKVQTLEFGKLDGFLKDNPGFGTSLPPGQHCPALEGQPDWVSVCVEAQPATGAGQLVKIIEKFDDDVATSEYKVTDGGIVPLSYSAVRGMEGFAGAIATLAAGVFALLLGLKIGGFVADRVEHRYRSKG